MGTEWSACDVTCGDGSKYRTWLVSQPKDNGGADCPETPDGVASESCATGVSCLVIVTSPPATSDTSITDWFGATDMIPFERDPVEYLTEERLDHYFSTNDDGYFCRQITKRQGDVSVLVALKSAVPYSGSLTMSWRSRVANGGDGGNKMVELFLGPENLDPYSWDKYKSRQTWGVLYK